MSTGAVTISSGVAAAMSSIDVPPLLLATITGPPDARSMRMDKYSSRRMYTRSVSNTVLHGLPSGPVCLVISWAPSMFLAASSTAAALGSRPQR